VWRVWRIPLLLLALAETAAFVVAPQPLLAALPSCLAAGFLAVVTLRLTRPAPPPYDASAAQLACVAGFYLFGLLDAARFYGQVHVLAPLGVLEAWLDAHIGDSSFVMNPLLGGVVPALALWSLGVRPRELGLQLGRYGARTTALWCSVPAALIVYQVASGAASLATARFQLLAALLRAAMPEELFNRGVVQSRLERFGPAWAVVGSSLLFGLGHMPMQIDGGAPGLVEAAARCMVFNTGMGLVFALLFWRTRSLLPSTLLHMLYNALVRLSS
jgi:membrane protease YdiL (CAAX protease family)